MAGSEELDTRLDELSGELRVILPGATVLFAFLLTLPFAAGFPGLEAAARAAYFVAFLTTALAVILLLGESAYHRLRGHPYDKERMLRTASRQAVSALGLLAVALTAVVFLVADVVYDRGVALLAAAVVLLAAVITWFTLPLSRRLLGR
jgi:uncharacterized membrane protein